MALQKDILSERVGNIVADAYIKFSYLRWSDVDSKVIATFSVTAYSTAESEGKEAITHIDIDETDKFPNLQALMYVEIKKLSEYSDALDV